MPAYVTLAWDDVDTWLEEEEIVIVHPRDPYHRIDVQSSSREVSISVAGEEVARSAAPRILFETGLPPRYYLERSEIEESALTPTPHNGLVAGCAYKGFASYFDVPGAEAIAWTYPEPLSEAERVRDRICFFQERSEVELRVDGTMQEAPKTQRSGTDWIERSVGRRRAPDHERPPAQRP